MTLLSFPPSPTLGQLYEFGNFSWTFNGTGWALNAADALDYETGTWTPTCFQGAMDSVVTATYTKIGNQVTLFFDCVFPTSADADDAQVVGGFPFVLASEANGVFPFYNYTGTGSSGSTICTSSIGDTSVIFLSNADLTGADGPGSVLVCSDLSGIEIFASLTYQTA